MASKDVPVYQKHTALIYTVTNPANDIPSIEGLVMRDLPPEIPPALREIIRNNWRSLPEFALACGLKFSTVQSVLCRSSRRKLNTLEQLAQALETNVDMLVDILLIEDLEKRKKLLDVILDGKSLRQWAIESGVSQSAISMTVNSLDHSQLSNVATIAKTLGVTLQDFSNAYKEHTTQTA